MTRWFSALLVPAPSRHSITWATERLACDSLRKSGSCVTVSGMRDSQVTFLVCRGGCSCHFQRSYHARFVLLSSFHALFDSHSFFFCPNKNKYCKVVEKTPTASTHLPADLRNESKSGQHTRNIQNKRKNIFMKNNHTHFKHRRLYVFCQRVAPSPPLPSSP